MAAELPKVPRGLELEDYVAALFQSTQHYVERNVCEPDVLELDVVATSFAGGQPDTHLIEVKSGQWGFGDLFKTLGRMHYLSIPKGLFITTRPPEGKPVEFYAERVGAKGLRVMVIEDIPNAPQKFTEAGYGTVDQASHWLWRYSFWAERRIIETLRAQVQERPEAHGPRAALQYFRLVNDEVFLTSDPRERALKLYEGYMAHPRLTHGIARELDGEPFDAETQGDSEALRNALLRGHHSILQASMYVEHRARLAVLKTVIDCLAAGVDFSARGLVASALPTTFLTAARELRQRPQYSRYALFWQILLWGWGGLILDDFREDEEQALARQSGLDRTNVESALGAFDLLFPSGNEWIRRMNTANYRFVAMVPWPFMGIGAFRRIVDHGVERYEALGLSGDFTTRDLARRHVAAATLLSTQ